MRAILDTNVLVSGVIFGGTPRRIVELAQAHEFTMVVTQDIIAEYTVVVERVSKRYDVKGACELLDLLIGDSDLSFSLSLPQPVCAHQADDKFLAAALAAGVTTIVSGDKHLRDVSGWSGISVHTPSAFLKILEKPRE